MQPRLTKKILKLIENNRLTSVTVDIFDTILLNDYWPEKLRYYDLAKRLVMDLCQAAPLQITAYELLELRKQAERELHAAERPLQIDLILDSMLDLLSVKYSLGLSDDERLQILATMIATEIQFKINNTRPNHNLIAQLKNIKELHPEVKFYFVSDTPFFAEQIKTMLQILDIKIFDDGVCSSDLGYEKQTGEIFEHLDEKFALKFNLLSNLHLGDHRIPDYLMPILHDSYAIHYRPVRARGLRALVGKTAMSVIDFSARQREKSRCSMISSGSANAEWQECGAILGQYQQIWSTKMSLRAELNEDVNYILTGKVSEFYTTQFERENMLSSNLDKTMILRAFVWLLATFETTRWNAGNLLRILTRTAGIEKREELYRICFGEDCVISALALESLSDEEFCQVFLAEVKGMEADKDNLLRTSYGQVVQLLPRDNKRICLIEQNDDNVTLLFREFARLHGVNNEINEWVLDIDKLVLRLENAIAGKLNRRRTDCIVRGRQNGLALLRQTELAADDYAKFILKPQLKKLVKELD